MNQMAYFDQILLAYTFKHYLATGMQIGDEALPTISPASIGQEFFNNMLYLDKILLTNIL